MGKLKLNLGRLDQCSRYSSSEKRDPNCLDCNGTGVVELFTSIVPCKCLRKNSKEDIAYQSVDLGSKIFYYINDKQIDSMSPGEDHINIPTFDIGSAVTKGRINDPKVVDCLLSSIELSVLAMIKNILSVSGSDYNVILENINIPIRRIQVFDDNNSKGSYGWAEVGVSVVV